MLRCILASGKAVPYLRLSGAFSFVTSCTCSVRASPLHISLDDILSQWMISSPDDVTRVLSDMSFVITTLTDLGMSVSDAKTVIIDGLRGTAKSRLLKPLLQHHKQKGTCLRLQGQRGNIDLPFRKQHPYLGIVLSYDKFEQLSLQARIKQGWANFSRLFSILRSKYILPKQRLQLWVSCVFSTLRYGLTSSGLPSRGADRLRQVVAKQVRLVLRSPSWITHESTSELFSRYNFEDPIAQLARALEARRAKASLSVEAFDTPERQQWHNLLPSFFASSVESPNDADLQPSLARPSSPRLQEVTDVLSRTFQCPSCPQTFATICPTYPLYQIPYPYVGCCRPTLSHRCRCSYHSACFACSCH